MKSGAGAPIASCGTELIGAVFLPGIISVAGNAAILCIGAIFVACVISLPCTGTEFCAVVAGAVLDSREQLAMQTTTSDNDNRGRMLLVMSDIDSMVAIKNLPSEGRLGKVVGFCPTNLFDLFACARIGTIDYEHEHRFTEHEHGCRFVGTGDWRGVSK